MFSGTVISQNIKTRFYITTSSDCDSSILADVYSKLVYFQENVAIKLSDMYSCVRIMTQYEMNSALDNLRQRALLGEDVDNKLSGLGQSLTCDYLISLKMTVKGQTAILNALCLDPKKAKTLCRAMLTVPYNGLDVNAYEKVGKELIDGLKTYEICPFKGEIKVKVLSTKKDNQTEEYPLYCNGVDGMFHKATTINNYTENDWTIQKVQQNGSTGNVMFNLSEEFKIEEENSCFDCSPKKQGPRTYYENTKTYSLINGLSSESESYGIKVDDARCYLTFLEDGTYTLRVTAASTQGEKKTIKEISAQGVCQNINEKPKSVINKIDEGLNQTLGPFNGNAQDKVLSQKDTIKKTDPISGEEQTITYEFNLTRD